MSEEKTITIEIDGQTLEANPGELLIDITDAAGINIPRFCYHNKLSISANCRMCLVEVDKVPKPIPACATRVMDGMKVKTRSPIALAAQKSTMEFLLINHPLDCPVCDQGGECELQDIAMGFGDDVSRFVEGKRVVPDNNVGPLIATDMTRCIHCTRCVRFGDEIAGMPEMGAIGRGEHMTIGTFVARNIDSEMSGNVIDLCPVGALTSKPFQYRARAWELARHDSIAPHDSVGSNIQVHVRRNEVMRVHPRANEAVNEVWISDRDRFSYEGINSADRLTQPLVKQDGEWQEASWEEALAAAATALGDIAKADSAQIGTLVSPTATLEEIALAQKITSGLGSTNIDYRLRQADFRSKADGVPWLGQSVASLEDVNAALLIGSNVRKDQPLIAHRLRKATLKGGAVAFVNPVGLDLHFDAAQMVSDPAGMVANLAAIVEAAGGTQAICTKVVVGEDHKVVAEQLTSADAASVLLGSMAQSHPDYSLLCSLASALVKATGASLGVLPAAANSVGAAVAGATPSKGLNAKAMLEKSLKGYLLLGMEPGHDLANPAQAQAALAGAESVVAVSAYRSQCLDECADILLPMAAFTETSGTYVNAEGTWQSFNGAVSSPGEARPGWKILRVLGNLLDIAGFDYISSEEVRDELQAGTGKLKKVSLGTGKGKINSTVTGLTRIGETPIYAGDALVRRAMSLQQTTDARDASLVRANASVADKAGVADGDTVAVVQGDGRAEMVLRVDSQVPDGCVWVSAAVPGSESLGDQFGDISLEKV
ncbi:NADH-ubiquinone oxidoreductase chain G [hydrothermal vent metagenome]|uniref:NADH-ubiquinone oxidoreductase chain G n=1 Tax=hydrothermal vent metagenome TaxID=652676 RepID=A0A3B1B1G7_9ZZZZ